MSNKFLTALDLCLAAAIVAGCSNLGGQKVDWASLNYSEAQCAGSDSKGCSIMDANDSSSIGHGHHGHR